jgi:hypothetical protein
MTMAAPGLFATAATDDESAPVEIFPQLEDTPEYVETLKTMIPAKYHDCLAVFLKQATVGLPRSRPGFDHDIRTWDNACPHSKRLRHTLLAKLDAQRAWIQDMLDKGLIVSSRLPWAANLTSAPKKDENGNPTGELRWCVDYWGINEATIKDRTPLPLISESLALLSCARVFTKFDLRSAFNQLKVAV